MVAGIARFRPTFPSGDEKGSLFVHGKPVSFPVLRRRNEIGVLIILCILSTRQQYCSHNDSHTVGAKINNSRMALQPPIDNRVDSNRTSLNSTQTPNSLNRTHKTTHTASPPMRSDRDRVYPSFNEGLN